MLKASELLKILERMDPNTEVRVGDVVEGSKFHCSVGTLEWRNDTFVITPANKVVWKEEHKESTQLWPEVGA